MWLAKEETAPDNSPLVRTQTLRRPPDEGAEKA